MVWLKLLKSSLIAYSLAALIVFAGCRTSSSRKTNFAAFRSEKSAQQDSRTKAQLASYHDASNESDPSASRSVAEPSLIDLVAGDSSYDQAALDSAQSNGALVHAVTNQVVLDEGQDDIPIQPAITGGELSLEDVKRLAILNNEVIKRDADFLGPINEAFVDGTPTVLDPEIADSGFLFGQRGVQAALSDFDWRWNKQIGIGQNELIQNNRFLSGGIPPGGTLSSRTGQYILGANKVTPWGGQIRLSHQWDYNASNVQDSFYPSSFSGFLRGEIRQPLLAGAGRQVTSVAGPINDAIEGVTGVTQGVLVAKFHTQEAREQLNIAVSQLLRDVQVLYEQLAASNDILQHYEMAQRTLEDLSKEAEASIRSGAKGGAHDLLQIQQSLDSVVINRLAEWRNNQTIATRLSRLLNQSITGEDIATRHAKDPTPFVIDVEQSHETAIYLRSDFRILELRERSLRAQYLAAKNLNRPQLNFVSGYNINGFGDKLFAEGIPGPDRDTASAYENLFQNDHTGWDARLDLTSVYGRRLAKTRERNIVAQLHKVSLLRRDRSNELLLELHQTARDIEMIYQTCMLRSRQCEGSANLVRSLYARQVGDFQIENSVQLANAIFTNATNHADRLRARAEYQNALCELLYRQGRITEENDLLVF